MARWAMIVWAGLVVAGVALVVSALLTPAGPGPVFWTLMVLVGISGVLAWLAMSGDRRVKIALILVSGALSAVAIFAASLVLALSLGQSPITEIVGWPIAAVAAVVALAGAILSLREAGG